MLRLYRLCKAINLSDFFLHFDGLKFEFLCFKCNTEQIVNKVKSKSALLSMLQHVQDIQRIEITLLSDTRCNSEHLP